MLKQNRLGHLRWILSVFTLLALFEGSLRMFWHPGGQPLMDPADSKRQALTAALSRQSGFFRDRFCDAIHQTLMGEREVASCVLPDFRRLEEAIGRKPIDVLALGASTTHGYNCDSETSWPKELAGLLPDVRMRNLASDGSYSDESLTRLESALASGGTPAVVLWSHGLTEFLFYGDQRDRNWGVLSRDQELVRRIRGEGVYKENFILKVLRWDITLQKYSWVYRWMRITGNRAVFSLSNGYRRFLLGTLQENQSNNTSREQYVGASGLFNGPIRVLFSEPALEYAIRNYLLNLEALKNLSLKHHFRVMCLKIPHVPGLLDEFSGEFSRAYDGWIDRVNAITASRCLELGFAVTDVSRCYSERAAPRSSASE
ncbi:MAG: hypothetical protein EBS90_10575 [Betaproteobacteria bacterium]|nr:hypothetical protein [Betaproteobacteria bacterium]